MKTPKFFELIGSSKGESSDPRFRVFVELTDKDKDFWEIQALGTAEGRGGSFLKYSIKTVDFYLSNK